MKLTIYQEAQNIWKEISTDSKMVSVSAEVEIHKRLLNLFQVGDFYYYIFNLRRMDFDFISHDMEKILGYPIDQMSMPFFMQLIHPDDLHWFLAFEQQVVKFFNAMTHVEGAQYKVRYDYRIRRADNSYIRLLHQMLTIMPDENGVTTQTLCVHTDITHLKSEGLPVLSFIGMDGAPSYLDVKVNALLPLLPIEEKLTKQEKKILRYLIEGKLSKQIADILFVSTNTVNTHRRNMLRKTKMLNTAELIGAAIKGGWI
jgi:DNA-binding CsgD family transcriptional regulator